MRVWLLLMKAMAQLLRFKVAPGLLSRACITRISTSRQMWSQKKSRKSQMVQPLSISDTIVVTTWHPLKIRSRLRVMLVIQAFTRLTIPRSVSATTRRDRGTEHLTASLLSVGRAL